jgi:arginine/lysine/ornithine decarboxylase
MAAGADLAATSVHKLGGSMTQSSVLNMQGNLVKKEHVQSILSMLTTTSTSYILLASLDAARMYLKTEGHALIEKTIQLAESLRQRISQLDYLDCPGSDLLGTNATYSYDPTKILISVKQLGLTGYDVEKWLREHYQIEVELSDMYNILCIITPGDSDDTIQYLLTALTALVKAHQTQAYEKKVQVSAPPIPVLQMSPREAFYSDTEVIPLNEASGRVSAESIMVYPPGIPIFIPGEIISEESLRYIEANVAAGLPVQGLEDESLETIHVIKEMQAIR